MGVFWVNADPINLRTCNVGAALAANVEICSAFAGKFPSNVIKMLQLKTKGAKSRTTENTESTEFHRGSDRSMAFSVPSVSSFFSVVQGLALYQGELKHLE
ncbi:hypothetical protein VN23_16535 [Janthinobacterium sp. B9-8]|nr:hypothetical protein VN23_16535 [Janthinobacterium sp. B9-8]